MATSLVLSVVFGTNRSTDCRDVCFDWRVAWLWAQNPRLSLMNGHIVYNNFDTEGRVRAFPTNFVTAWVLLVGASLSIMGCLHVNNRFIVWRVIWQLGISGRRLAIETIISFVRIDWVVGVGVAVHSTRVGRASDEGLDPRRIVYRLCIAIAA